MDGRRESRVLIGMRSLGSKKSGSILHYQHNPDK